MKFTYNWLLKFLDTNLSPEEIGNIMTNIGIEVESIFNPGEYLKGFSVAYVEDTAPHPNADKLKICKVSTKSGVKQIICGAANARSGIKVVFADVGTIIPNGEFTIKLSKIRGEESCGMLCSFEELKLDGDSNGIIELPEDAIIGAAINKYLGLDDVVYEISVTPNRGDWLGVYGIARDLAAKGAGTLKKLQGTQLIPKNKREDVSMPAACKLLGLMRINNIRNTESPEWVTKLLKQIGINPISAAVDVTNYFSVSYGRPLHAYDADKISGSLSARLAYEGEIFTDLLEKTYSLCTEDLVIADKNGIRSLAGIIGSYDSRWLDSTKNIILESAIFDNISVTKSGRKHNIISDARSRFERGIDEAQTIEMLYAAGNMILELCGGEIDSVDIKGVLPQATYISFDPELIEKRIGINLEPEIIEKILTALGFEKQISEKRSSLDMPSYKIPSWRHDITCSEVLAEEVARIYGFEHIIPSSLVQEINFSRILTERQRCLDELKRMTASLGYNEVISWSFMSSKKAEYCSEIQDELRLINPISSELDYMRPSIIPNLMDIIAKNHARSIYDISIFEAGPIFLGNEISDEHCVIAGVVTSANDTMTELSFKKKTGFFEIKSDVNTILQESGINIDSLKISTSQVKYLHPGRSASYFLGKKLIAHFGEIHPQIMKLFSLETRIYGFEIYVDNIPSLKSKMGRREHLILSQYQPVTRDFAYIFDEDLKAQDLLSQIHKCDNLIKSVEIFDIYSGEKMGHSKKSIAFRVRIEPEDGTLEDHEIGHISSKIMSIAKKFGGEIRG
ncbi:MAG: phenylalanine--tRNA ligase subunit beta [Rickettsiaceae bacterium]|nr:phenylalanine--tRNA ligase subunit beta [Rickettsiaceae bacterium]